jgi:4-amino-4-deoxy-L-arabinose transferase-like glycosyltransferase
MGWAAVCWVVFFWGLGTVPLLDPDEAHYAQITREMLAAGEWVVPLLEGQQHVDKPVLFHWVQGAAFGLLGESEVAARVPPVLASLLLLAVTWWCGAHLFGPQVGERAALMFATMPATFALSGIAIFDMLFALFLFGGLACLVIGALEQRAGLQYGGFVLVAGAVLTKGPAAVVLMVIAAVLCLLHPATRPIALRIRWLAGLAIGLALTGPWFLVLWHRVGDAFFDQYVFQHNLSLFGAPLYRHERNPFFYARIFFTAFLPWSPIVIGRVIDLARGWRTHRTVGTGEVVLWAWAITVFGFFSLSWFKLDTYVYPAVPAICLLASHAWQQERARSHWSAVRVVLVLVAIAMVGIGIAKALLIFQLDLPLPRTVAVVPAAVVAGGAVFLWQLVRAGLRPPAWGLALVVPLLIGYAKVAAVGFPLFAAALPTDEAGRWLMGVTAPGERVGVYRLEKWKASLRYYANRPVAVLEAPMHVRAFYRQYPGAYCLVLERDVARVQQVVDVPLEVVFRQRAIVGTEGRGLRRQVWGDVVLVRGVPAAADGARLRP